MKPIVQSAELFLLAWLVFMALGSLVAAAVVRVFGRQVSRWEPRTRHRALLLLAALPVLTAAALMLSATLPSLLSLELPGFDHCTLHHDGHPHLCFLHLPSIGVNEGALFVMLVFLGYGALRAGHAALRVRRALRLLRGLGQSGEIRTDLGVTILESEQPICVTAGLFRPRVLLSRGLLASLSDEERAVVLAHERAHVRRRDALVATIVRVLAFVHVAPVARWLLREVDIAAEQACDEEAGRVVDDRLAVASAILAVERVTYDAFAPLAPVAVAFGQRAAERRVEALLAEPVPPRSLLVLTLLAGGIAVALLSQSGELHHLIESLLSYVAY